jgi:hypothetical protein
MPVPARKKNPRQQNTQLPGLNNLENFEEFIAIPELSSESESENDGDTWGSEEDTPGDKIPSQDTQHAKVCDSVFYLIIYPQYTSRHMQFN